MSGTLLAKKCTRCGDWKAHTEYYASPRSIDGLHGSCKKCQIDRAAEWKRRNAETVQVRERIRSERRRNDPANLMHMKDGWAKYRELNRDKVREKNKKHGRLQTIRLNIAIEVCRSLGIDIDKLAKEKYDAELRAREAIREKFHKDRGVAKKDSDGEGGHPGCRTDGRCSRAP